MDRVITRENKMTNPTQAEAMAALKRKISDLRPPSEYTHGYTSGYMSGKNDALRIAEETLRSYIEGQADALKEE